MSNKEKINCDEGRKWNCSLRLMLSKSLGEQDRYREMIYCESLGESFIYKHIFKSKTNILSIYFGSAFLKVWISNYLLWDH